MLLEIDMSNIMELIDDYANCCQADGAHDLIDDHETTVAAHIAVVEAVEKLEKDAARYRWLRDKSCAIYLKEGPDSHGWFHSDGEDVDDAADAAMSIGGE